MLNQAELGGGGRDGTGLGCFWCRERQDWDGDRVLMAASGIAVFIGGQGAVAEALAERIGVVQLGVESRETDLKARGLKAGISKRQDGTRGILKASAGLAWVRRLQTPS